MSVRAESGLQSKKERKDARAETAKRKSLVLL